MARINLKDLKVGDVLDYTEDGVTTKWRVTEIAPLDCPAGGMVFAQPADREEDNELEKGFQYDEFDGVFWRD